MKVWENFISGLEIYLNGLSRAHILAVSLLPLILGNHWLRQCLNRFPLSSPWLTGPWINVLECLPLHSTVWLYPQAKLPLSWAIIVFRSVFTVSLPRGRFQEIKRMALVNFTNGLFLTCTQKSHYIYRSFIAIFTRCTTFPPDPAPCI